MFSRSIAAELTIEPDHNPAVALLGPRQVGKTTPALAVAQDRPSVYLDRESERDRAKLDNAELYLTDHLDKLVILDEVHRAPALFPLLRGLIDQARRSGRASGQYLLLGSASLDLLQQSGETLAGRISYLDMTGLTVQETGADLQDSLWLRGGFPGNLLLVRRLAPWHDNQGKRLVKSTKVYVRDSGLVHALLHIGSKDDLPSLPVVGASWEGFCIENLPACAPRGVRAFFHRSSSGAEVDLVLWPDGERWAIEIKPTADGSRVGGHQHRSCSCAEHAQESGSIPLHTPGIKSIETGDKPA